MSRQDKSSVYNTTNSQYYANIFPSVPTSATTIVQELKNSGRKPVKIIVFTDVGQDIDDAALLVLLASFHKMKVVEVLLVVANVKPTESRAKAAKVLFEEMGLPDVPVASGSDGTDEDIALKGYEFKGVDEPQGTIFNGETTIVEKLEALRKNKERCNMIIVISLRDLSELIQRYESLVKTTVSNFFFQGAWEGDYEYVKALAPDMKARNNSYDRDATTYVYNWLRQAAKYIYDTFGEQERKYYEDANKKDPKERYMLYLDARWYANKHPRWREAYRDILPEAFEHIQPYIQMTLYDVVAGLICPL